MPPGFEPVGDEELILVASWRAGHDANRAAWMNKGVVRAAHFDQGNDLCPGLDVVRLMRHWREA